MQFCNTFKPMKIGDMLVKNRLVVPPMDSGHSGPNGEITDKTIAYYTARARGGFGMVIIEICAVNSEVAGMPGELDISKDEFLPQMHKLAEAIQHYAARAIIQLHHAGREMLNDPVGPSPCPSLLSHRTPAELTREQIYGYIEDYINAAERCKKAGFDGVELHCGHGYLPSQFISPRSNKRIDEFGGDVRGRMHFAELCLRGIKERCGKDFPVIVRISSDDHLQGGVTIDESVVHAKLFESYGADAIHVSLGTYGSWEYNVPTYDLPGAFNLPASAAVKKSVNIPVISVGRYVEPTVIENAIATGDADFISVGRQSIADPEFANKMFSDKLLDIVPCLSCSQRCNAYHPLGLSIGDPGVACVLNPLSSNASQYEIKQTENPKKIMIVGAGPAGLETAWIAAKRGHDVSVYDKSTIYGGQFYIAAFPPYKQRITSAIRHYVHMCNKYGVKFHMGCEVTEDMIKKENPDALVIATGSKPLLPPIKGIDNENISLANDVLLGKCVNGNTLILGGGLVGVETAEYCLDYATGVTVVEMGPTLAPTMSAIPLSKTLRRFKEKGIITHVNTKVVEIHEDGVTVEQNGELKEMRGYDSIVLAMGSKAYNPFADKGDLAKEVHVIGDAKEARSAAEAILEGALLALEI